MDVLLSTASIMNLCLISLDRYWSITKAVEYLKTRTPARALVMIAAVWIMSALICIPPLLGWGVKRSEESLPQCEVSSTEIFIFGNYATYILPHQKFRKKFPSNDGHFISLFDKLRWITRLKKTILKLIFIGRKKNLEIMVTNGLASNFEQWLANKQKLCANIVMRFSSFFTLLITNSSHDLAILYQFVKTYKNWSRKHTFVLPYFNLEKTSFVLCLTGRYIHLVI